MKTQEAMPKKPLKPLNELGKFVVACAFVYATSYSVMQLQREAELRLDGLTAEAQAREYVAPKPQPGVKDFVAEIARANGFEPKLIEAMIDQESRWRVDAMRFEPGKAAEFREAGARDDEVTALSTSFGLMQVIFGLHRESCGLKSPIELFEPRKNIACGVKWLKHCFNRRGDVRKALACYNGSGANAEEYADEVLKRLANKMVG